MSNLGMSGDAGAAAQPLKHIKNLVCGQIKCALCSITDIREP